MLNIGVFIDSFGRPLEEGLQLAVDFGCSSFQVCITGDNMLASVMDKNLRSDHIGAIGEDPDGKSRETMIKNLKYLGDFAAEHGVVLATETGLESGPTLRDILEEADTKGIGVNLDPANLVMNGFDHLAAVRELFPFIVHTHAKDGVNENGKGREVLIGEGGVNFPVYVGLLRELGYNGAYTIEREAGDDPVTDIRMSVEFLKKLN